MPVSTILPHCDIISWELLSVITYLITVDSDEKRVGIPEIPIWVRIGIIANNLWNSFLDWWLDQGWGWMRGVGEYTHAVTEDIFSVR